MKHITKNWADVLKLAGTDDQTGSSVQDHLQPTDDLSTKPSLSAQLTSPAVKRL